jgi:hypothetical protein
VGALSKRDCRIHFVLFSGNVSCGWVRKQHGAVEVPFIDFAQPDPQLNDAMQTAIVEQTSFNYSRKEVHDTTRHDTHTTRHDTHTTRHDTHDTQLTCWGVLVAVVV